MGITISHEAFKLYNEMQANSTYAYATFKLENGETLVIDQEVTKAEADNPWDHLLASLKDKEPRFILFEVIAKTRNGRYCQKLILMYWCTSSAGDPNTMLYNSAKSRVKASFSGVAADLDVTTKPDRPIALDELQKFFDSDFVTFYTKQVKRNADGKYEYT